MYYCLQKALIIITVPVKRFPVPAGFSPQYTINYIIPSCETPTHKRSYFLYSHIEVLIFTRWLELVY